MLTQQIPFNRSLPRHTANRFSNLQQMLKKSVPATIVKLEKNNTIATVKFEIDSQFTLPQMKMPIYGPEYVRWPLQEGCKGYVVSSDIGLGGMSGLGEGVATLTPHFNLSTGVFFPIGNTEFDDTDDPQKTVVYGPNGVILRDGDKHSVLDVDKDMVTYKFNDELRLQIDNDQVLLQFPTGSASSLKMTKDGLTLSAFGRTITMDQNAITLSGDGNTVKLDASGITEYTPHTMSLSSTGPTTINSSSTMGISSTGNMNLSSSANIGVSGAVCAMNGTTQSSIGCGNATVMTLPNRAYSSVSGFGSMDINPGTNSSTMSTPWNNLSLTNTQALLQYGNCYVQCHSNGNSVLMGAAATYTQVAGGSHYTAVTGGNVQMVGTECYVASRRFLDHNHWGVQSGGSNTQGVN